MDRLDRVRRKYSPIINVDTTKVMASNGIACRILIQNEQLEQEDTFPYLGSLFTEDQIKSETHLYSAIRRKRMYALRAVRRQPTSCVNVGAFNARSVSSNGTSQSISAWVTDLNLTAAGLVETWHDGSDIPRRLCAFWLRLHGASETKA